MKNKIIIRPAFKRTAIKNGRLSGFAITNGEQRTFVDDGPSNLMVLEGTRERLVFHSKKISKSAKGCKDTATGVGIDLWKRILKTQQKKALQG